MIRSILLAAAFALAACTEDSGVMREIERAEKADADAAQQVSADAGAFLEQARAQPGVEARPSGLLLERRGRGPDQSLPRPTANATVLVHYEGRLADGSVFDSSFARNEPAEFPLNAVVDGFSEAIQQMRPGDEVVATFPMELGYGPEGRPPVIPPAAPLQFRIILLAFQEPGGRVVQAPPR
ncbi:MAG: FKBP-type peptidyl-prolyl cis-trans isomerase [Hyphomonadaceae bacterium]|nr:FKBP-type peptidyl-prolyl cis-trans isomerase [Hyphomonadaceae bacterium]